MISIKLKNTFMINCFVINVSLIAKFTQPLILDPFNWFISLIIVLLSFVPSHTHSVFSNVLLGYIVDGFLQWGFLLFNHYLSIIFSWMLRSLLWFLWGFLALWLWQFPFLRLGKFLFLSWWKFVFLCWIQFVFLWLGNLVF